MAGIEVKYEILNQRQTPAFYASSLATRPAFGFAGRMFIDSDSPSTGIYRDTGSAWVQVADQGAGTTGTLQNVTTNGNTSNTGISVTANGIGIGTTIPASNRLDIHSASGLQGTFNGTGVTNAGLQLQSAGVGKWSLLNNHNSGANDFQLYDVLNGISRLNITNAGVFTFTGAGSFSNSLTALQATFISSVTKAIEARGNANSLTDYPFDFLASTRAGNGLVGRFAAVSGLSNGYTVTVNNTNTGLLHLWDGQGTITGILNAQSRLNVNGATDNSTYQLNCIGKAKFTNSLNINNVPTSSAGLVSGDIYSTAGVLNIVP
jgi:hypothetical protein